VHPTQLYEVAMTTVIFLVLWRIRRHSHAQGWLFMLWLSLAGLERFLVEFLRAKDDRFFGPLTMAQVISLAIIAVGIVGLQRLWRPLPGDGAAAGVSKGRARTSKNVKKRRD